MPEKTKVGNVAAKPVLPFQKRKQLERDIEHVTEEMYKRNKELAETNKTLSLLRTIDALVLESHASLKTVCEHITEAITQATDYPFVGLFTRSTPSEEKMTLYGYSGKDFLGSGLDLHLPKPAHVDLSKNIMDHPNSSHRIALEDISANDVSEYLDYSEAEVKHLLKILPLKSVYVVKLVVRRRLVGLLVAGFYTTTTQIGESDVLLMDRLSESIGVALDNKLLFEENQRVLRQLKLSNAKLRALDEAKDDFISMASHQLRTPLTSVKGYISMVVEGDAGELNDTQKNMLGQAFLSSQRMVYLIADLLNVSRLRTGKFVIETSPVNLSGIIEEELAQLTETAKSRKVTLNFKAPKDFPDLMLDDTKIRQVIMNFADNAIYYSKTNGHVDFKLVENAHSVELRITDDGIGVPKSEQHHLFTKFYRAGNARKARPDGTGLGLFMAKKVIIAQGGVLIFESKEGKGSTFGFSFNKSKVALPDEIPEPRQTATEKAVKEASQNDQE
jgi:signal transduction histidine kinase